VSAIASSRERGTKNGCGMPSNAENASAMSIVVF
jgi:hypothetical protein